MSYNLDEKEELQRCSEEKKYLYQYTKKLTLYLKDILYQNATLENRCKELEIKSVRLLEIIKYTENSVPYRLGLLINAVRRPETVVCKNFISGFFAALNRFIKNKQITNTGIYDSALKTFNNITDKNFQNETNKF